MKIMLLALLLALNNTTPTTNIGGTTGGTRVGYGGTDIYVINNVSVNTRPNPDVGTPDYATITKPASQYAVTSFVVPMGIARPDNWNGVVTGVRSDPCAFYGRGGGACGIVEGWTDFTANETGNLNGTGSPGRVLWDGGLVVPDLEVGHKFCVALSVWPANSHGTETNNENEAMAGNHGSQTHHGEPACIQIAKKPTLQVRSAGLYTKGGIKTAQTYKVPGFNAVGQGGISISVNGAQRRIFGSWVEYEIIALRNIQGIGSGATFGYNPGAVALPGGYISRAVNRAGQVDLVPDCHISRLSMATRNCLGTGGTVGSAAGPAVEGIPPPELPKNIEILIPRLLARYCPDNGGSWGALLTINSINDAAWTSYGANGTTKAICSRSNVLINTDILNEYADVSSIEDIPQYLIIAPNISIAAHVTRADAWLIAVDPLANSTFGQVETCAGGSTPGNPNHVQQHGADACVNSLTINGPVFADRIITMRTAGSCVGNASIDPAEIFNLRSDTYLWAWAQSEGSGAAVTTYMQDMPPRF